MTKAVFFDIDGTLKSFETHSIPESTVQSIKKLREKGIKVFVATGRTPEAVKVLDNLSIDGYVLLNGSFCLLSTGVAVYKHTISKVEIEKLIEYEKENPLTCVIMAENITFTNKKDIQVERFIELLNFPEIKEISLVEALNMDVFQVVLFFEQEKDADMLRVLTGCDALRWHATFADFVPKNSHKGIGIDKMIAHFGISLSETMAFGDGGNDISMLRHAAVGVAMGNAGDDVKKAADYVTDTVDNDGVYKALKAFDLL
ncbi:MAG: Cof-type HAD-IIB family hydrolase [Paludibacteraceae bacterium]